MGKLNKTQENELFVIQQKRLGVHVCMIWQFPNKTKRTVMKTPGVLAVDGNRVIFTSEGIRG